MKIKYIILAAVLAIAVSRAQETPAAEYYWSFDNDTPALLHEANAGLHLQPAGTEPAAEFTEGISGKALLLKEGSKGQYISKDDRLFKLAPPFTIASWIRKKTTDPKQSVIVATAAEGAETGFEFCWMWRRLMFRMGLGPGKKAFSLLSPPATLTVDTWHHVAVSCGTDKAVLFIDGTKVAEAAPAAGDSFAPAENRNFRFTLGHFPNSFQAYQHIGEIDELRIFNKTLNEEQIARIMTGDGE